jgi:hypothetical protein
MPLVSIGQRDSSSGPAAQVGTYNNTCDAAGRPAPLGGSVCTLLRTCCMTSGLLRSCLFWRTKDPWNFDTKLGHLSTCAVNYRGKSNWIWSAHACTLEIPPSFVWYRNRQMALRLNMVCTRSRSQICVHQCMHILEWHCLNLVHDLDTGLHSSTKEVYTIGLVTIWISLKLWLDLLK